MTTYIFRNTDLPPDFHGVFCDDDRCYLVSTELAEPIAVEEVIDVPEFPLPSSELFAFS